MIAAELATFTATPAADEVCEHAWDVASSLVGTDHANCDHCPAWEIRRDGVVIESGTY